MGNKSSANTQLSADALELVTRIFQEIDEGGSLTIDMEETKRWWHHNFAAVNTRAMFDNVDKDHNGKIDFDEWVQFWTMVKHSGHTDEEIKEELLNIHEKGSWVQFRGCPQSKAQFKD